MFKIKFFTFCTVFYLLLFNRLVCSQVYEFMDDFESYLPGQQLACQDSVNWTTFFGNPCNQVEDPIISTNYSVTGTKSLRIIQNNDLVKPFGSHTFGYYYITFWFYIPSGKAGYFNTLAVFNGVNSNWAMECYFDAGGAGRIFGGSSIPESFNWIENEWQFVALSVSLMNDVARFYLDNNLVHTWQWTDGIFGGGSPLSIEASCFFGATPNDEMYIDNYVFNEPPLTPPPLYGPTNLLAEEIFNPFPQVKLTWQDNSGYEHAFNVLRKDGLPFGPGSFKPIGTAPQNATVYIDSTVVVDSTYTYAGFAYNVYGFSDTSNFATIILKPVNVTPVNQVVNSFSLWQNYPNPFNPKTSIQYVIDSQQFVTLKVYDILGNEIATLVNEDKPAGEYEVEFNASSGIGNLVSGIYFYKLKAGNFIQTKKMILLK